MGIEQAEKPRPPSRRFWLAVAAATISLAVLIHRRPARVWRLSDNDSAAHIVARGSFRGWPVYAARGEIGPSKGTPASAWGQGFLGRFNPENLGAAERPYIILNRDTITRQAIWITREAGLFLEQGRPANPALAAVARVYRRVPRYHHVKALLAAQVSSTLRHECRHFDDRFHGFSLADLETRAYLEQLTRSSLPLATMPNPPATDEGLAKLDSHVQASYRIWNGLKEYPDMAGGDAAICALPQEELARRARELYERWYGIYEPLDPECTGALSFKDIYARS